MTVTPVTRLQLPATDRDLVPVHGRPRTVPFVTLGRMANQPVLELLLGDVVRLRRAHPCGGRDWLVNRLGADIGLRCERAVVASCWSGGPSNDGSWSSSAR